MSRYRIVNGTRACPYCKRVLDCKENFHATGVYCKLCYTLRLYDLSYCDYSRMLIEQEDKCAICSTIPSDGLSIDHCHLTGKVRGLLCRNCNVALGHVDDDIETLCNMIKYLDKHN